MPRLFLFRRKPKIGMGRGLGFSPSQVSDMAYWYDASNLGSLWQDAARTTPVVADGDPVGAWDDLSGNDYHVTQGTAGNRPTYKTAVQNGLPVLRGDGSNDYLENTSYANDYPVYFAAVVIPRHATDSGVFHDRTDQQRLGLLADTGDGWRQLSNNAGTHRGTCTEGAESVVGAAFNTGTACFVRVDGVEGAAEDLSIDQGGSGIRILRAAGAGASATCDICELIAYSAIPSAGDRASLESYLTSKWGGTTAEADEAPNISYAGSPFTENIGAAMSGGEVTNSGGASTDFVVLSGSLPPGISLNATTGELTGTPV